MRGKSNLDLNVVLRGAVCKKGFETFWLRWFWLFGSFEISMALLGLKVRFLDQGTFLPYWVTFQLRYRPRFSWSGVTFWRLRFFHDTFHYQPKFLYHGELLIFANLTFHSKIKLKLGRINIFSSTFIIFWYQFDFLRSGSGCFLRIKFEGDF